MHRCFGDDSMYYVCVCCAAQCTHSAHGADTHSALMMISRKLCHNVDQPRRVEGSLLTKRRVVPRPSMGMGHEACAPISQHSHTTVQ
jgi:hypothetical protein